MTRVALHGPLVRLTRPILERVLALPINDDAPVFGTERAAEKVLQRWSVHVGASVSVWHRRERGTTPVVETEETEVPTHREIGARIWRRLWAFAVGASFVVLLSVAETGWPWRNPFDGLFGDPPPRLLYGGLAVLAAYAHPLFPRSWTAPIT